MLILRYVSYNILLVLNCKPGKPKKEKNTRDNHLKGEQKHIYSVVPSVGGKRLDALGIEPRTFPK